MLLELDNITKKFGGLTAVNKVTTTVEKGDILGIIGPNGAGKTTLFGLISGFLKPTEGGIRFKSEEITRLEPNRICRLGIARTFQIAKPFGEITTHENVMIGAFNRTKNVAKGISIADRVLERTFLSSKRNALAKNLTVPERKKLELAKALATSPEIIMLDEPMGGLTPTEIDEMTVMLLNIQKEGMTILIIEHVLQAVMNLSHRIMVLNYGIKIAEGSPSDIGRNSKVIEAYLGEEYVFPSR
jgi:branched-chain amino acid transport system ATP-binding protein